MTMLSFAHYGKKYTNFTPEEALEAGVPQEILNAEITKYKTDLVKAECRRRIYAQASPETQMNMATAVAVISSKTATTRTDDEKFVLAGVDAALGWVQAMKSAIADLVAGDDDYTEDTSWPEIPTTAAQVVEQF